MTNKVFGCRSMSLEPACAEPECGVRMKEEREEAHVQQEHSVRIKVEWEEIDGQQQQNGVLKKEDRSAKDLAWSLKSDVKEESALLDLYAGHKVEGDLVLGPEGPQLPDSAFAQPTYASSPWPSTGLEGPDMAVSLGQAAGHNMAPGSGEQQHLNMHRQTHTRPYFCYMCQKLLVHSNTHSGEEANCCEACSSGAHGARHASLREQGYARAVEPPAPGAAGRPVHGAGAGGEGPQLLGRTFAQPTCARSPQPGAASEGRGEQKPAQKKPYSCDVCMKQFNHQSNLIEHRRIHTAEKPYSCDVCTKQFTQKAGLVAHRRTHTGEKPYSCDACMKQFTRRSTLYTHRRTHTAEKPHSCDVCMMQFTQKTSLVAHVRTHTGEKPYSCDVCRKQFTQLASLVAHRRTHTGEKPYSCDVCMKHFRKKAGLVAHIRTHTREKPYSCDVCMKQFKHQCSLVRHRRIHSGEERPFS